MPKTINGDKIGIDEFSQINSSITSVHHHIHEGEHYYMEGYAELNDTDTLYVKMETGSKQPHLTWEIDSTGVLTTELYEGASGGMTGGDSITPLNSNRDSTKTSTITLTKGVTAPTSTGTTVSSRKGGVDGRSWRVQGTANERDDEIMLKKNTTYCRKFLSGSNSNIISFRARWYEEQDKS